MIYFPRCAPFAGSSVRNGKSRSDFYDRQGRYSGTVIDTGPRAR